MKTPWIQARCPQLVPGQGLFSTSFLEGEKWGRVQGGLLQEGQASPSPLTFLLFIKQREGKGGRRRKIEGGCLCLSFCTCEI